MSSGLLDPANNARTPTWLEFVQTIVEARLVNLHVSMPGTVVTYYPATQTADIQPDIQKEYFDGSAIDIPILPSVPIAHPRSAHSYMHLPLSSGDPVMLVFCERSLDNWKVNADSQTIAPQDSRKFDLSDAWAYPGGAPDPDAFTVQDPSAVEISNTGGATLQVKTGGKFKLTNGTNELFDLVDQLLQALLQAQTPTIIGPQPFIPSTLATLNTIKTALDTLKG